MGLYTYCVRTHTRVLNDTLRQFVAFFEVVQMANQTSGWKLIDDPFGSRIYLWNMVIYAGLLVYQNLFIWGMNVSSPFILVFIIFQPGFDPISEIGMFHPPLSFWKSPDSFTEVTPRIYWHYLGDGYDGAQSPSFRCRICPNIPSIIQSSSETDDLRLHSIMLH